MTLPFRLDYSLAMASVVGDAGGLSDEAFDAALGRADAARAAVLAAARSGVLGFWALPKDRAAADAVRAYAASVPASITDVIVLGIGGSSLGGRTVLHALAGAEAIADPSSARRRLHFPDNSDPWALAALLKRLDPTRTLVVLVSKSGGTVETAAQWLILDEWLEHSLGAAAAKRHVAVITDPESGPLRQLVRDRGLASLPIPANVGGRFSVLTAVGLLPAALLGADVDAMLLGAAETADACERTVPRENPAALLAALHVAHHERGRGIHVFMPYSDALRPFAAWFVQLWAESLGKRVDRKGRKVESGPTPIPAVGATDQHAQVQLFMEGPRDKLVTFLSVDEHPADLSIPTAAGPFAYLGGRRLSELLDAERRGTALALASDGRPSLTIAIERVDARALGALFFLYEAATAFAGELYDIDAFDQPGVELGKRLAFGLLGREGYDAERKRIEETEARAPSGRYRVG